MGLFWKGKTDLKVELYKINLDVWGHSRNGKAPSYKQRDTVHRICLIKSIKIDKVSVNLVRKRSVILRAIRRTPVNYFSVLNKNKTNFIKSKCLIFSKTNILLWF